MFELEHQASLRVYQPNLLVRLGSSGFFLQYGDRWAGFINIICYTRTSLLSKTNGCLKHNTVDDYDTVYDSLHHGDVKTKITISAYTTSKLYYTITMTYGYDFTRTIKSLRNERRIASSHGSSHGRR